MQIRAPYKKKKITFLEKLAKRSGSLHLLTHIIQTKDKSFQMKVTGTYLPDQLTNSSCPHLV